MDRPSGYAKSVRKGTVPTILALVLLVTACLVQVTASPASQGDDEATMRQLAQYIVSVGQQQYDRGSYSEAEKTLQKAQDYAQHLDVVEQKKLEVLRARVGKAVVERRRIDEAKRNAQQLNQKGDVLAARTCLEAIQDSELLSVKERLEISDLLSKSDPSTAPAASRIAVPSPERRETSVAETYYRSMTAYQAGDLKAAKEGFTKVLESGELPAVMVDSVRDYLARIEAAQAGTGVGRPVAVADVSAQAMPTIGAVVAPANLRAQNVSAGQSESERIQGLYNRSRELYIQGDLAAAREGFVEVDRSGLISAPPGLRPQDYIAQIDQQLAFQGAPSLSSQTTLDRGVTPLTAQPTGGEGGFVEEINRRKATIRDYAESIVNDSIVQADQFMAQGDYASARDQIGGAIRVVNDDQYRLYLEGELYKRLMQRLNEASTRIGAAEAARNKQLEEQKRQDAAAEQERIRTQAEEDRQRRIDELMVRARAHWKRQQYEAALGQLEALLVIDSLNDDALTMKDMVEDMIYYRKQLEQQKLDKRQTADIKLSTDEAAIPYADEITYPKDWREIIQKPTRRPDEPFQLDAANSEVYNQLDQTVDLSGITRDTPANEAFEILRSAVQPPLNLVVLWRDLEENVGIDPASPVQFDGPASARLGTALDSMLRAISDPLVPDNPVEYVVNRGVVTVATRDGLPRTKLETRVYDVSDLVSPPASGMSGGMMGGMMGGMGGGMMTSYQSMSMAYGLRDLIEQSIEPDSWYDLSETGQGTITIYPTESPKKLAISATPEVHKQIDVLLDQLRMSLGHQVSIEARYLVVTENFLEDIGLDLDMQYDFGGKLGIVGFAQGSSTVSAPAVASGITGNLGNITNENPSASITGGYGSVLDDLQVTFLLRATQARTDSKSLAAPKVTVLSGEQATFSLWDSISWALPPNETQGITPTSSGTSTTTTTTTQNMGYIPVGSTLYVTPTITKDKKYVLLNIQTMQSDLLRFAKHAVEQEADDDDSSDDSGDANNVVTTHIEMPETQTASVSTRVSVPDRGTLLLGGHKLASQVDKEAGVPVLSKIPIIGALFSNRSHVRDQKILLILVKPTIILQEETEQEALASLEEPLLSGTRR